MKDDCLLYFENPSKLRSFIKSLDIYNGWKIQSGVMNTRGKQISEKGYAIKLRNLFKEKKLFRKNASVSEIVSWLDNLYLISKVLDELGAVLENHVFKSIEIVAEYKIEMSKNMRVDYIFLYKNNLLIIELRTVNKFEKLKSTWEKKFQELLVYKELMQYYISGKNIILYALIALYEYDNGREIIKHKEYNNNQVKYLSEYILRYLIIENNKN